MQLSEKKIRLIFILSILLKALNGVLEVILGIAFLYSPTITDLIQRLVRRELIEDPTDVIANAMQHLLPFLTHNQYFVSLYFLSHGAAKILLVASLLRNKLWAYPAAIVVFALFIIYQLYRYAFTHSFFLILLTVFDVFIIILTWHEYNVLQKRKGEIEA